MGSVADLEQEHRRLKALVGDLCREMKSPQFLATRADVEAELRQLQSEHRALRAEWDHFRQSLEEKANFNPNQPRVPAGNPDGGQWTSEGGTTYIAVPSQSRPVRLADASNVIGSPVLSDATPDPIVPGSVYAQTQINIDPSALTGISRIDEMTRTLTRTLATVVDTLPEGFGPGYGTIVHVEFAKAVRAQSLPGVEVETTFSLLPGARYGSKDSIRTDVILRNDGGDITAIYDVKTGGAIIEPERAIELRAKSGVGINVPIIELNVRRGVMLKYRTHTIVCWARDASLQFI